MRGIELVYGKEEGLGTNQYSRTDHHTHSSQMNRDIDDINIKAKAR